MPLTAWQYLHSNGRAAFDHIVQNMRICGLQITLTDINWHEDQERHTSEIHVGTNDVPGKWDRTNKVVNLLLVFESITTYEMDMFDPLLQSATANR